MFAEREKSALEAFEAALALPRHERASWLEREYGHDGELVFEVNALLAAHEEAGDFLDLAPTAASSASWRRSGWRQVGGVGSAAVCRRMLRKAIRTRSRVGALSRATDRRRHGSLPRPTNSSDSLHESLAASSALLREPRTSFGGR
jgi:hypothetical protein